MKDNFDQHKWFKNQYLNENINPIDDIEAKSDPRNLKHLQDLLRIFTTDLIDKEIDKKDIKSYLSQFIDQI